uniref:Uncharacterized protein n=1 Tax=Anguilla anguilla TaxID=7936 RepID=A0A0E9X0L6_ANGAN
MFGQTEMTPHSSSLVKMKTQEAAAFTDLKSSLRKIMVNFLVFEVIFIDRMFYCQPSKYGGNDGLCVPILIEV